MATRSVREAHPNVMLSSGGSVSSSKAVTCDKCDGAHETSACPHFKGDRDKHQDAWSHYSGAAAAGLAHLKARECVAPRSLPRGSASVVRMPGDGSCLFHSIAYGLGALGHHEDGRSIRQRVANFMAQKPDCEVAGTPLRSWVNWDSGTTVNSYCSRLSGGSFWGGGLEMAAAAQLFSVDVAVYEEDYYWGGFRRISDFLCDTRPIGAVLLVYSGRAHYDALRSHDEQAYYGGGTSSAPNRHAQSLSTRHVQEEDSQCGFM